MKPQKLEPYQRSRHRAALHAWVVAATAVASIGMPAAAVSLEEQSQRVGIEQTDRTASQSAQRVAGDWIASLRMGSTREALSMMRLPGDLQYEQAAADHVQALADWLAQGGAAATPIAHRHAGHWALSAWRFDLAGSDVLGSGRVEPVMLYNPASDDLFDDELNWQVVPHASAEDPALAPLINADHAELWHWYQGLA